MKVKSEILPLISAKIYGKDKPNIWNVSHVNSAWYAPIFADVYNTRAIARLKAFDIDLRRFPSYVFDRKEKDRNSDLFLLQFDIVFMEKHIKIMV